MFAPEVWESLLGWHHRESANHAGRNNLNLPVCKIEFYISSVEQREGGYFCESVWKVNSNLENGNSVTFRVTRSEEIGFLVKHVVLIVYLVNETSSALWLVF